MRKGEFDDSLAGSENKTEVRKSKRARKPSSCYAEYAIPEQKKVAGPYSSPNLSANVTENQLQLNNDDLLNISLSKSQGPIEGNNIASGDWADIDVESDLESTDALPGLLLQEIESEDECVDSGDESDYEDIPVAIPTIENDEIDTVPGLMVDKNRKRKPLNHPPHLSKNLTDADCSAKSSPVLPDLSCVESDILPNHSQSYSSDLIIVSDEIQSST